MDQNLLTPKRTRSQHRAEARVDTAKPDQALPLWVIAAAVLTGVVLLALT